MWSGLSSSLRTPRLARRFPAGAWVLVPADRLARPTLDQAALPARGEGDEALAAAIDLIVSGATLRPGAELSEFGVRWLVGTAETSELIGPALQAQVDMNTFPFAEGLVVFENTAVRPVAVTESGVPWEASGSGFVGEPTEERVRLAFNADPGWGPDWQPEGWAGSVSGRDGEAVYRKIGVEAVLVWLGTSLSLLGLGLGIWGGGRGEDRRTDRSRRPGGRFHRCQRPGSPCPSPSPQSAAPYGVPPGRGRPAHDH